MADYGVVSFVGAGPGAPEYITRRGIRRLRRADVVFHDKLSPNALFDRYCPETTEIVDVGKRKGKVGPGQEQINDMLKRAARDHEYVVRLKGGDPFLFGRGGEEAGYLAEEDVPFEVVPGVSSLLAAPTYAGIPLTHREYASEVGVITGHVDPEQDHSRDWGHLAQLETLVVMMGVTRLGTIVERLLEAGLDPETPLAVVGWGTRATQEVTSGPVRTFREGLADQQRYLPGLVVIGDVVKCRQDLDWTETLPLFGRKIISTRPERSPDDLESALGESGAEVRRRSSIRIQADEGGIERLQREIETTKNYDGLVLTSRNGVEKFARALEDSSRDVRCLAGLTLACIGPGTADELSQLGLKADLVPESFRAEGLADLLLNETDPGRWLLPRARGSRETLIERLEAADHQVNEVHTYEAVPNQPGRDGLRQDLQDRPDMVTFTSSSTVESLFELFPDQQVNRWLRDIHTACIGPITADTLRDHGIPADVVASQHDIPGLVDAIGTFYDDQPTNEELTGS